MTSRRIAQFAVANRLVVVAAVAVAALAVSLVTPVAVASSASTTTASTYLLYAGHGVGVVATENPTTGCGDVYLTDNFIQWRNISPPVRNPAHWRQGLCAYTWSNAYFVSPRDGWLVATNGADVESILRHTTNGGRTWTSDPSEYTGSAGGSDTISFVNATLGWRQQFGMGSNGNYALQRTEDAGVTWSTRSPDPTGSCVFANDVFSSASRGFASVPWVDNPTHLWRTTNGGISWSTLTFPPPPSLPSTALGLYGAPEFAGSYGVEPVDYPVGGHQAIYFYVTHDGGASWTTTASEPPIAVGGVLHINRRNAAAQSCTGPVTSSRVAIVSPASTATWWAFQPGPKGATKRIVVGHGGLGSTTYEMNGLPATTGQIQIAALNINDALVTFAIPYGYRTTYETSNGGVTWERTSPVASGWTVSDVAANCATSNLRMTLGRTGAALGHIGMYFDVKNVGTRTCELDGYPTVQMIAAPKRLVPTLVNFGSDYTVPPTSPRVTLIKPGERAVFMLGYADQTGYGLSTCPTATTLQITPPGNLASQDLRVEAQPYGGTIQRLRCGEIAVSPIMSVATWKHITD
jgi:photosystem II stability/assembly factor-like uncharacterized protein